MTDDRIRDAIRPATARDLPGIRAMQARALRAHGRPYYAATQLEGFLEQVGTMDASLIEEGRCWVIAREGPILASGGWSLRHPDEDAPVVALAPRRTPHGPTAPTIRALYVDPEAARRGYGRAMVARIEAEIRAAGFNGVEMDAPMTSLPFCTALGYWPGRPVVLGLAGDFVPLMGVAMTKSLAEARPLLAA